LLIALKEKELFECQRDSKNLGNIITIKEKVYDEDDQGVKLLKAMKDAAIQWLGMSEKVLCLGGGRK
jgi:hypothetical protein